MTPHFNEGDLVRVKSFRLCTDERLRSPYGIVVAWKIRFSSMRYWVLVEGKLWNFGEGELSSRLRRYEGPGAPGSACGGAPL